MKKSISISILLIFILAIAGSALAKTGQEVYDQACGACHNSGIAHAPKLGDKDAWAPRIKEGMDELYHTALHGEGAMPAKGGMTSLSDDEVKAAVDYMVEKSK